MLTAIVNNIKKFRDKIFSCFSFRRHATMELIDALSGNVNATSVVALSENPVFTRSYSSIHDVIHQFHQDPEQQSRVERCLLEQCASIIKAQPFRLMVLDCTSAPRPHAKTLQDRSIVYAPNPISDNKPITFGHSYSVFGFLPESQNAINVPWMLPLSARRVSTGTSAVAVGIEQMQTCIGVESIKDIPVFPSNRDVKYAANNAMFSFILEFF
jgi:hypothetical protein